MNQPLQVLALAGLLVALAGCADHHTANDSRNDGGAFSDSKLGGSQAPQATEPVVGDDDPAIYPYEVAAPAADWDDAIPWGGSPPWTWFEDPGSVDCKAAKAWCEKPEYQAAKATADDEAVLKA